jgi:hypothetical protein
MPDPVGGTDVQIPVSEIATSLTVGIELLRKVEAP